MTAAAPLDVAAAAADVADAATDEATVDEGVVDETGAATPPNGAAGAPTAFAFLEASTYAARVFPDVLGGVSMGKPGIKHVRGKEAYGGLIAPTMPALQCLPCAQ